jgi:hypothetical protein
MQRVQSQMFNHAHLQRLDLAHHLGEFVANQLVRDQRLAKGFALERVLHGLLIAEARLPRCAGRNNLCTCNSRKTRVSTTV